MISKACKHLVEADSPMSSESGDQITAEVTAQVATGRVERAGA